MSEKRYLIFETIPKPLKEKEKILAVNIDISGIQKFIFGNKTILDLEKDFSDKSAFIACLAHKICHKLQMQFEDFILFSDVGGTILCGFKNRRKEKQIALCLDAVQRDIFILTKGNLQVFYGCAECVVTANKNVSSVLPHLSALTVKNKYSCKNILFADLNADPDLSLLPEAAENTTAATPKNAVAVKLDLDNLGVYFASIPEIDRKMEASNILNNIISSVCETAIYVGGDDIFAVVPFENALQSTAQIYLRLKERIKTQLPLYYPSFGISAGMCGVGNSVCAVPTVFYLNKSDEYLEKAKRESGKNSICVENECFSWEEFIYISHLYEKYTSLLTARMGEEFMRKYPLHPKLLKQDLIKIHRELTRKGNGFLTDEEVLRIGE